MEVTPMEIDTDTDTDSDTDLNSTVELEPEDTEDVEDTRVSREFHVIIIELNDSDISRSVTRMIRASVSLALPWVVSSPDTAPCPLIEIDRTLRQAGHIHSSRFPLYYYRGVLLDAETDWNAIPGVGPICCYSLCRPKKKTRRFQLGDLLMPLSSSFVAATSASASLSVPPGDEDSSLLPSASLPLLRREPEEQKEEREEKEPEGDAEPQGNGRNGTVPSLLVEWTSSTGRRTLQELQPSSLITIDRRDDADAEIHSLPSVIQNVIQSVLYGENGVATGIPATSGAISLQDDIYLVEMETLTSIGFQNPRLNREALYIADGNLEVAVTYLMNLGEL